MAILFYKIRSYRSCIIFGNIHHGICTYDDHKRLTIARSGYQDLFVLFSGHDRSGFLFSSEIIRVPEKGYPQETKVIVNLYQNDSTSLDEVEFMVYCRLLSKNENTAVYAMPCLNFRHWMIQNRFPWENSNSLSELPDD